MYVPIEVYEADPEWQKLKAERDRILNSEGATGFVKAQNALAAKSEAIRIAYQDESRRGA